MYSECTCTVCKFLLLEHKLLLVPIVLLSVAGMHLNPHFGGSLSMVPESYVMNQQREYPWPAPPNPPPPPLPPPPNPHPPINNTWSMDWPMQQGHEYEQRMRSQSWAGLVSTCTCICI